MRKITLIMLIQLISLGIGLSHCAQGQDTIALQRNIDALKIKLSQQPDIFSHVEIALAYSELGAAISFDDKYGWTDSLNALAFENLEAAYALKPQSNFVRFFLAGTYIDIYEWLSRTESDWDRIIALLEPTTEDDVIPQQIARYYLAKAHEIKREHLIKNGASSAQSYVHLKEVIRLYTEILTADPENFEAQCALAEIVQGDTKEEAKAACNRKKTQQSAKNLWLAYLSGDPNDTGLPAREAMTCCRRYQAYTWQGKFREAIDALLVGYGIMDTSLAEYTLVIEAAEKLNDLLVAAYYRDKVKQRLFPDLREESFREEKLREAKAKFDTHTTTVCLLDEEHDTPIQGAIVQYMLGPVSMPLGVTGSNGCTHISEIPTLSGLNYTYWGDYARIFVSKEQQHSTLASNNEYRPINDVFIASADTTVTYRLSRMPTSSCSAEEIASIFEAEEAVDAYKRLVDPKPTSSFYDRFITPAGLGDIKRGGVRVSYVIDKEGVVHNVQVAESAPEALRKEISRVLIGVTWTPGKIDGQPACWPIEMKYWW